MKEEDVAIKKPPYLCLALSIDPMGSLLYVIDLKKLD